MTGRPTFYCDACGGMIAAGSRMVDVDTVRAVHAKSCPGTALAPADAITFERARHGEAAAARYATATHAGRLARKMPQSGDPDGECLCDITEDGYWQLSIICPVHVTATTTGDYL